MTNASFPPFPLEALEQLLPLAFEEDVGIGDITTRATVPVSSISKASLIAKSNCIIAGLPTIPAVFNYYHQSVQWRPDVEEGDKLVAGQTIGTIQGPTQAILECERIILNFIQRLSGIATQAGAWQALLSDTGIQLLDTRKTIPGYRLLDKYAVSQGGAYNHRIGLHDAILIKDNHIQASGGCAEAVDNVTSAYNQKYNIEIEVTTLNELNKIIHKPIHWIMLDNMDANTLRRAVSLIREKRPDIKIEISGNVTAKRLSALKTLNVDYISSGALTHSVSAADISLKFLDTWNTPGET